MAEGRLWTKVRAGHYFYRGYTIVRKKYSRLWEVLDTDGHPDFVASTFANARASIDDKIERQYGNNQRKNIP